MQPGKNGVNPHEFIVKNGEVGVETRQKEAAAFRIQFGMPVGWNEVVKIFTDNAVSSLKGKDNLARARPTQKRPISRSVRASHLFGCTMGGKGTWVGCLHCLVSTSASLIPGEKL